MNLKKSELVEYIALGAKTLMELTYEGHRPSDEQQRIVINAAQSFGITFEKAYNMGKSVAYHEYKEVANRFKKDVLERIARHIDDLILQAKATQKEVLVITEPETEEIKEIGSHIHRINNYDLSERFRALHKGYIVEFTRKEYDASHLRASTNCRELNRYGDIILLQMSYEKSPWEDMFK